MFVYMCQIIIIIIILVHSLLNKITKYLYHFWCHLFLNNNLNETRNAIGGNKLTLYTQSTIQTSDWFFMIVIWLIVITITVVLVSKAVTFIYMFTPLVEPEIYWGGGGGVIIIYGWRPSTSSNRKLESLLYITLFFKKGWGLWGQHSPPPPPTHTRYATI